MNINFTHLDSKGAANMVDVSSKASSIRTARAVARIKTQPEIIRLIMDSSVKKGDVFSVARVAGIMAAKKTAELIPLCHPLLLSKVSVDFKCDPLEGYIYLLSCVSLNGQTGVEMEALTAVSVAALTIYDMCKSADKSMLIESIGLIEKTGGKSGSYVNGSLTEEIGAVW